MTTFNDTFDKATPAGSDDPAEADDRMREIKAAVQERENVDHYWPLTGTEVSDVDTGEHRKVTLRTGSAPVAVADKGFIYAKDVAGKAELFYRDEDGNEVQITNVGGLGSATTNLLANTLDVSGNIDPTTYETTNGGFLDEDDLVSDAADKVASQQSIKAYVDAKDFGVFTNQDDESQTIVKAQAYLANQDGFVTASVDSSSGVQALTGFVGATNDPAGAGTPVIACEATITGHRVSITFPVQSGKYFEVTTPSSNTVAIFWHPVGTLVKPTDQD